MKKRKILLAALIGLLLAAAVTVPARAAFAPGQGTLQKEDTELLPAGTSEEEGRQAADADLLLYRYLDHELFGEEQTLMISNRFLGERLSGTNLLVYDALLAGAEAIAAGTCTDTRMSVDLTASEFAGIKWFAEDLGIESLGSVEDGKFVASDAFKPAFYEKIG